MEADDVLRYAFRQGPGRDLFASTGTPDRPLTTSFGTLPEAVAADRMCRLVWGTVDLLEATAYPDAADVKCLPVLDRIQHALVMAFGLQRREPSNLFNDHRACASVRSKFPVHTFVHTDESAWLLDVYRHSVLPVGDAAPGWPDDQPVHVALAGRYTHLPSLYGRLRGPLVELELGISLRSLWVALEVLGLTGELRLPGPAAPQLMAQLGLDPPEEWSVPLSIAVGAVGEAGQGRAPSASPTTGLGQDLRHNEDDPTLGEAVAINRMSLDVAAGSGAASSQGRGRAVPEGMSPPERPWSEVLWHRNSGRMPRQLAGVSGRRRPVAGTAVTDSVAWLALPPPTAVLQHIARRITVSACVQDAGGFATGWYRLERGAGDDARLELLHADPTLPARLEACYGHGLSIEAGCAVRHANMVWLLSADVASLVETFGPGAWTLAQYVCGWMAHGLCLSAAAHGLYARPSRAFDEFLLHPLVGMASSELVLLSVVSGAGRFTEPTLDLRT